MVPETRSSLAPFVAMNSSAPSLRASSFLLSVLEKTTTWQPIFDANWMARCPSPPTPIMPTRSVALTLKECKALKTVAPPHISGAAYSRGIEEGML